MRHIGNYRNAFFGWNYILVSIRQPSMRHSVPGPCMVLKVALFGLFLIGMLELNRYVFRDTFDVQKEPKSQEFASQQSSGPSTLGPHLKDDKDRAKPGSYYHVRQRLRENCEADNDECQRFRQLLSNWPKDKPKAVIYIIFNSRNNAPLIRKIIKQIHKHFNRKHDYPIILFHEKDVRHLIQSARAASTSNIFMQEVKLQMPDFVKENVSDIMRKSNCVSKIGYRHMCRFQAKLVFEQPIMKGVDYYWRLDDDSKLVQPVTYDLFAYMRDHNLDYGYCWIHFDAPRCTVGLWEAAREYINKTQIKTQFFKEWTNLKMFYNNFEISRMSIWMSKEYADYIDLIDKKGGIYYHRWGDAPIKSIAVSMFVPKRRIHRFWDIGYVHGTYFSKRFTGTKELL